MALISRFIAFELATSTHKNGVFVSVYLDVLRAITMDIKNIVH